MARYGVRKFISKQKVYLQELLEANTSAWKLCMLLEKDEMGMSLGEQGACVWSEVCREEKNKGCQGRRQEVDQAAKENSAIWVR